MEKDDFKNVEERYEQWEKYKRLTPTGYPKEKVLIDRTTSSPAPRKGKDIDRKPITFKIPKNKRKKIDRKPNRWVTADLTRNLNHEKFVVAALRDFAIYVIFLTLISVVTFGVMDNAYHYYAHVLSDVFTYTKFNSTLGIQRTFRDISTIPQIWEYIREVFMKVLYENDFDESKTIEFVRPTSLLVLYSNILVGVPRIRQVRVGRHSCQVAQIFGDYFSSCYNYYSTRDEDKQPFGEDITWTFKDDVNNAPFYEGIVSNYGPGGFSFNLDRDKIISANLINILQNYDWIRLGTRAVFIDFTTYTPNTNLFCVAKLVFELPPTGGVLTSSHFHTMKFIRYVHPWDYFILSCELVLICFALYYTVEEFIEMVNLKFAYFKDIWNYLDLSIVIVSYACVVTAIIRFLRVNSKMASKIANIETNTHAVFDDLVQIQVLFNTMIGILCFLAWLKLLKFAALIRSVALVLTIFVKVCWELVALLVMLSTLVIGFALFGHVLFGTSVENFDSIKDSIFTLIGMFVGGMYFYKECEETRPILAPVYFTLYIFVVIVLFLNCFIALIVHGFYLAHEEFEDQRDRVFLIDIINRFSYNFLRFIKRNKAAERFRQYYTAKRNQRVYNDLANILRRHGFRGLELELMLKKNNIISGEHISYETMDKVYKDINTKNQLYLEVEEHDKIAEQTNSLNQKIEFLDRTLADMTTKVQVLVDKLYQEIKDKNI